MEVEQRPGKRYEMHQFNTMDSQGREERARSEPPQVIHSFGVSMMHCSNSWCRMSSMVEVCGVWWCQMWRCKVVLDKTGYKCWYQILSEAFVQQEMMFELLTRQIRLSR